MFYTLSVIHGLYLVRILYPVRSPQSMFYTDWVHMLIFVILIRHSNTKLLKSCWAGLLVGVLHCCQFFLFRYPLTGLIFSRIACIDNDTRKTTVCVKILPHAGWSRSRNQRNSRTWNPEFSFVNIRNAASFFLLSIQAFFQLVTRPLLESRWRCKESSSIKDC